MFGESWSIKELKLSSKLTSKFLLCANQLKRDLNDLLLDLSFYEELNIQEIKSIGDLPRNSIKGLKNTPRSHLEIWVNGKKIIKIRVTDLLHQNTLFKIYRTKEIEVDFEDLGEGLYQFEYGMGLVASYQFTSPKFTIDQLTFGFLKFENKGVVIEILSEIFLYNKLLKSSNDDTVITNSNCIVKFSESGN